MIRKTLLSLTLLLSTFLCAAEPAEGEKVARIDVKLETLSSTLSVDQKAILSRLKTQVGDPFSQQVFDNDLKTLFEEFDKIYPEIQVKEREVYITLYLWPKPVIRSIEWVGNQRVKLKTLQSELDIKAHSVFNRPEFNKQFNKLKEYYIKQGYYESQLSYKILPVPGTNQIDIDIDIFEGKSGQIKKLVLKGFTNKEKREIHDMIYTKQYNFLTSWFTGHGTYREEILEQDKMVVLNYLHNKGYADARVDIDLLEDSETGQIILEITTHRGLIYRFGKITFDGNHLLDDKQIESSFLIHPDDVYSPEKLYDTMQAIKDSYGQKGYIEADVQYETHLMENEPIYNVDFTIDEGEQYKIGMIRVFGNVQTKPNVILRESLLVPGQVFDSRRLKATEKRLEAIGYFKDVHVYAVRATDDIGLGPNYRDVYIEVEETTTGNVNLFLGFSSTDSIYGGLELTERNFNSRGLATMWSKGASSLRGGGEYLHLRAQVGEKQRNYLLSWMNPYFKDTLWRIGYELSRTWSKLQASDIEIITMGGSMYASYPITNYLTYGARYRARHTQSNIKQQADDIQDPNQPLDIATTSALEEQNRGIISAVGTSLGYDSTDSSYKPHRGVRSTADLEFSGIGGDFFFLKMGLINTLYIPIWEKGTMKYRGDLRFIQPLGKTSQKQYGIPISERFFLGGEGSVRGYKPFIIGPTFPDRNDPAGGVSSTLLSMEYSQEILKALDVFVFIDAGNVSDRQYEIGILRASYGIGARIEVMARAPISVGWGVPINPERKSDVENFFFSMGGQF